MQRCLLSQVHVWEKNGGKPVHIKKLQRCNMGVVTPSHSSSQAWPHGKNPSIGAAGRWILHEKHAQGTPIYHVFNQQRLYLTVQVC